MSEHSMPRFGLDGEHYAALVVGRPAVFEGSSDALAAVHDGLAALAAAIGARVAFVAGGRVDEDEGEGEIEGVVGVVLAVARFGARPATPDGAVLRSGADVPPEVWSKAEALGLSLGDERGLFLAAGGWSVATLHVGAPDDMGWDASSGRDWPGEIEGEKLARASADGTPWTLLEPSVVDRAAPSPCLSASYA